MEKSAFYYLDSNVLHTRECPYVVKGACHFLGSAYSKTQAMSIARQRHKNVSYCKKCCTREWIQSLDVAS